MQLGHIFHISMVTFTFFTFDLTLSVARDRFTNRCVFPDHLRVNSPWTGDYKDGDIVVYFREEHMEVTEMGHPATAPKSYKRQCITWYPGDKFLVLHTEGSDREYLCMEFILRGEGQNIVQIKTSRRYPTRRPVICDDSEMKIDSWPLIHKNKVPSNVTSTCPFKGGYNMYAYYGQPNGSAVCDNLLLLMRLESECDTGGELTINFRKLECVPSVFPREIVHRLLCVAHWTQRDGAKEPYSFVVLRHAEMRNRWFCLRTSDPLGSLQEAYLWMKMICGTHINISSNYLRLQFEPRVFSSTCNDEIALCRLSEHYCKLALKRHCANTCGECSTENEIGNCAFTEKYRGNWVDSAALTDTSVDINAYQLNSANLGGDYTCLNIVSENRKLAHRKVLLQLFRDGCVPRYTCVEMEKMTSSVMKFRLGNRHIWPLATTTQQKDIVCDDDNFQITERLGRKTERPARLLVKTDSIREVDCELPDYLHYGVAFKDVGSDFCEGCFSYKPGDRKFVIQPINCTENRQGGGPDERQPREPNVPLIYTCLATFRFYNDSHTVITRAEYYNNIDGRGKEHYLVWIFSRDNLIKVMKAGETFLYQQSRDLKSELVLSRFVIQKKDRLRCQAPDPPMNPFTTISSYTSPRLTGPGSYVGDGRDPSRGTLVTYNPMTHKPYDPNGIDFGEANVGGVKDPMEPVGPASQVTPKFQNSRDEAGGDKNTGRRQLSFASPVLSLLCACATTLAVALLTHQRSRTVGSCPSLNAT